MAKPIKETPVLKGKDARIFNEKLTASSGNKVTPQEMDRMKTNFSKLHSIAK